MTLKQLEIQAKKWRHRLEKIDWLNRRAKYHRVLKTELYWRKRFFHALEVSGWWNPDWPDYDAHSEYVRKGQHKKKWKRQHRNDVIVIFC